MYAPSTRLFPNKLRTPEYAALFSLRNDSIGPNRRRILALQNDHASSCAVFRGSLGDICRTLVMLIANRPFESPRCRTPYSPDRKRLVADMTEAPNSESQLATGLVEGLVRRIDKCLRATTLYSASHPMYLRAVEELQSGFEPVWAELGSLTLQVRDNGFVWQSNLVLPEGHTPDSISWGLFKEGIRSITLTQGVEEEEIVTFLGLVQRARTLTDEEEDDLRTLLWSADFQFIRYKVAELGQTDGEPMGGTPTADSAPRLTAKEVRESIREDTADEGVYGQSDAPGPNAAVNLKEFESTLYFLDKGEIDYLKEEVRREYEQNLNENVLSMLFDIFETQPDAGARSEIISILSDLLPHLLNSGDFHSVAYLISEAQVVLSRAEEMLPEHQRPLAGLTRTFSRPEAVGQLLEALEVAAIEPSTEEIEELFAHLTPAVLSTVLKWHGRLSNEDARTSLAGAIARMAESRPAMGLALESSEQVVVIEALKLVEERGLQGVGAQLVGLLEYDDVGVRVALVQALAVGPTPQTMAALVTLMEDPESEVRIAAVRALAVKRFPGAVPKLEEAVLGKKLRSRDLRERKAFFEAYAILAGESGMSKLEGILLRKGFWRPVDSDTRACAAMALGHVPSPWARGALQRAMKDRDLVVRSAATRALREDPQ